MRFGSALILALIGAGAAAAACGSNTERPRFDQNETTQGKGGSTGSSTNNGGKQNSGTGGGGPDLGNVTVGTKSGNMAVPDDDPSNNAITHPDCDLGTCADFPADPLLGDGVPANVGDLFGAADNFQTGSLCVLEPQLSNGSTAGAMMPANWVQPRFRFSAPSGYDVFEIRIHSEAEANDLVAYTKQTSWYLPKEIWVGTKDTEVAAGSGFANNAAGKPVSVTVRAIKSGSPGTPIGMKGDFEIAPVVATGSMVFWTVNSALVTKDSSKLLGFAVGDEGVAESLTLSNVAWKGQIGEDGAVLRGYYDEAATKPPFADGAVRCIGCHASTPDGEAVVFGDDWPWAKAAAMVSSGNVGKVPSYITKGGIDVMKMPWWGTQAMSKEHWRDGDRVIITSYGSTFKSGTSRSDAWAKLPNYASSGGTDDKIMYHRLAWIDVENSANINASAVTDTPNYSTDTNDKNSLGYRQQAAKQAMNTAYGLIQTGDKQVSDVSPSMSNKGDKIVYVTTDYSPDGHPDYTAKTADIKIVEYNDRSGGASTALAGASDANRLEYYPSFSPDDQFVAFTSAPAVSSKSPDGPYYNRFGEIHVIPADGGTSTRLAANDPVSCGGDDTGRGIINSWPKWAPDAVKAHGKTYYFVIFSSARKYGDEFSQQFELPENSLSAFKGLRDSSQLYLAAVVVDESGGITTYPAVYVWNQNRLADATGKGSGIKFSNLTPDWAPFQLPPLVIESVPVDIK